MLLQQEYDVLKSHLKCVVDEASSSSSSEKYSDDLDLLTQLRSQLTDMQATVSEETVERQRLSELLDIKEKQRCELSHRLTLECAERQRVETLLEARQELDNRRMELELKRKELRSEVRTSCTCRQLVPDLRYCAHSTSLTASLCLTREMFKTRQFRHSTLSWILRYRIAT